MIVRVQYMAQLRTVLGRTVEDVELPPSSNLAQLLVLLAARGGLDAESHFMADNGQVRPSLLLVVNGAAVPSQQAGATLLNDGDRVVLLPPIAGG